MATEWATSVTQTVSIPSANSDYRFRAALDALAAKARRASPDPDGKDSRRILAIELDLVVALKSARRQAMHSGLHGPTVDKVLLKVINGYSNAIDAVWV